jgi:hypothetical protein
MSILGSSQLSGPGPIAPSPFPPGGPAQRVGEREQYQSAALSKSTGQARVLAPGPDRRMGCILRRPGHDADPSLGRAPATAGSGGGCGQGGGQSSGRADGAGRSPGPEQREVCVAPPGSVVAHEQAHRRDSRGDGQPVGQFRLHLVEDPGRLPVGDGQLRDDHGELPRAGRCLRPACGGGLGQRATRLVRGRCQVEDVGGSGARVEPDREGALAGDEGREVTNDCGTDEVDAGKGKSTVTRSGSPSAAEASKRWRQCATSGSASATVASSAVWPAG